jgi:hypothetical protein
MKETSVIIGNRLTRVWSIKLEKEVWENRMFYYRSGLSFMSVVLRNSQDLWLNLKKNKMKAKVRR